MKLYTRLLVSYGYLVALVLIGAAGAAIAFHSLGTRIGVVLEDNFESVRASMDMLEALERQDSAVLKGLLQEGQTRTAIDASESAFLDALVRAGANVTEDRERPVLDSLVARYDEYRAARERLLENRTERPLELYEGECFPLFEAVKADLIELLDLNHQAMVRADREAQAAAAQRAMGYAVLTALALLSMGFLSRSLLRRIVGRLDELRSVAEAVRGGDARRRAAEQPCDELGLVAGEFNRLLDSQEELRGALRARQSLMRDTIVGLLGSLRAPAALIALNGDVVVSTIDDATTARISAEAPRRTEDGESVLGEGRFHFRLLTVNGQRPVAWLVERASTGGDGPPTEGAARPGTPK